MKRVAAALCAPFVGSARLLRKTFDLRDCFVFIGIGFAVYGGNAIYPGAGWFLGGAALFWLGARGT